MVDDEIISFLKRNERMVPDSGLVVDALGTIAHEAAEIFRNCRQAGCADDHDEAPAVEWYERLTRNWMALHKRYLQRHCKGAGMENAHQRAGIGAVSRYPSKIMIAFCLTAIGGKYAGTRLLDDISIRSKDFTGQRFNFQQQGITIGSFG